MTVSSDLNRAEYQGDGASTSFAYGFVVYAAADLEVYLDGIRQVGGYTVTNLGAAGGGNVLFDAAPAAGVEVTIVRQTIARQELDFVEGDKFPSQNTERAFDKLTVLIQDARAEIAHAVRFPASEQDPPSAELPDVATRANKLMGFGADGSPMATDAQITGLLVSAAMQSVVQAATLALARAALGVGGLADANTWTQLQTIASLAVSGDAAIGGSWGLTGVVTAPDLTADVDDFATEGLDQAAVLRVRTDGLGVRTISGIAGGFAGRELLLLNYGSNSDRIELLDSDAGSAEANRFQLDGRIYVGHSQGVVLWYDGDASVWRVKSRSWQSANDDEVEAAISPQYLVRPTNMHRHPGHPKAWVNFNASSTLAINDSYNVMGVTDNGTGNFTVNFETAFANTQYALAGATARPQGALSAMLAVGPNTNDAKSASAMQIRVYATNAAANFADPAECSVLFLGEQA